MLFKIDYGQGCEHYVQADNIIVAAQIAGSHIRPSAIKKLEWIGGDPLNKLVEPTCNECGEVMNDYICENPKCYAKGMRQN